jgi:polysaccharide pyruvyl transferase WcaK-like protein
MRDDPGSMGSKGRERRITVGLLGASPGAENLGVAALACGAVSSIRNSLPTARIFLLDYAKEPAIYRVSVPSGVETVELINIRYSKRFFLSNNIAYLLVLAFCIRLLPSRKWRTRILRRNRVLNAIQEADIMGSLAGGDSFSDFYGFGRLVYVVLPQLLVLFLGKQLVLLPQTIGPFKGAVAKTVARAVVRRASMVFTRDHDGLEAVRGLAGRDRGRQAFAYDMGFALEPRIRTERIPAWLAGYDKGIPLVGLNVSGLLFMGGYTHDNMFGIRSDYRRLMHDLIDYLVRRHRVHVMLVPHVFGTCEDDESDLIACRKIHGGIEDALHARVHLLEEKFDPHEMKALIGRCDLFLGSRMHACIAAISQHVPTVGLAYSNKFRGVFESVGMGEWVIDIRGCDGNDVILTVDRAYGCRAEVRSRLESTIPVVRDSVLGLFGQLSIGQHNRASSGEEADFQRGWL